MDERHGVPVQARARLLVDELCSCSGKSGDRGLGIRYVEREVVHSRPAGREEPADGRVVAERRKQLDEARADPQKDGLHALRLERLPVLDLGAEQSAIRFHRVVEAFDGYRDVVQSLDLHSAILSIVAKLTASRRSIHRDTEQAGAAWSPGRAFLAAAAESRAVGSTRRCRAGGCRAWHRCQARYEIVTKGTAS
jgi:hypothetical protein